MVFASKHMRSCLALVFFLHIHALCALRAAQLQPPSQDECHACVRKP